MEIDTKLIQLEQENISLRKELENVNFKLQLLFDNDPVSRFIFEMNYSYDQYVKIMDLMDEVRNKIDNHQKISSSEFEENFRIITGDQDHHSAEIISRLFMEERRWEEVFPALYGDF